MLILLLPCVTFDILMQNFLYPTLLCKQVYLLVEVDLLEYNQEDNILLDKPTHELFHINCLSYLEQMESADDLIYDNTVYLKNVNINLYNIESGYIWYLEKGNLKLDNVIIKHKITEDIDYNEIEIHNLFHVGNFCNLIICNSLIDYESETDSTFLFSGCLSNFYLNNTYIKLYSNNQLTQSNIFYLTYTKVEIVNSKIENLCYLGNIFFTDTETEIELSKLLSNFSILKGWMRIEKIREEDCFEKMLDNIFGILYQNKKYIFGNSRGNDEYFEIQVIYPDYSIPCNLELVREPEYQPLFLLDIIDSKIIVNNESNLQDYLENYYLLKLQSVIFSNLTQKKLLNFQNGKECNYDFNKGQFEVEKINTNMLSQVSLQHVCRQDRGYSMLKKEKVGPESIDLTTGESLVSGAFNFAAGYVNIVEGNYATVLGNNNHVLSSNSLTIGNNLVNKFRDCIVLGRYNKPEYDWKQKLLVVGNGTEETKSDALVVYESGEVEIYNSLCSTKISDGIIKIEEGNIKEVKNIEVEGTVFVNQDIQVEGEIKGARVLENTIPMDIIQMAGEILTTWKLDLSNFTSPGKYGGVFNLIDSKFNSSINSSIFPPEIPNPDFK